MKNLYENGLIKFRLFLEGIDISIEQLQRMRSLNFRVPAIVRAGASYGIEALINDNLEVNIPLNSSSKLKITEDFSHIIDNAGNVICSVNLLKQPFDFDLKISESCELKNIAKMCFDRLGITVNPGCYFKKSAKGCQFCGIDSSSHYSNVKLLSPAQVLNIIEKAMKCIGKQSLRHILLSGGVVEQEDFGIDIFAEIIKRVKDNYTDLPIYLMLPPPPKNNMLLPLIESGLDEISMNIELVGIEYHKMIPAKAEIGLSRYLNALEFMAKKMPKFSVRSILMAGIEPIENTLIGVEKLCAVGAMPILSFYRPVGDKAKVRNIFKRPEEVMELWEKANEIASKYDMILGPTCKPCQNNVIALPNTAFHKYY